MIRTLLKPLSFIPAILLMMMIYRFSAQPADVSSQLSYRVSYKIVETADYLFETNLDYWQMDNWAVRINGMTRKLAHMTEYFALAVAVSFPLYVYGLHGILLMLLAGLICVGFAAGDEYHQAFVAGRGPSLKDVGIDSFGVFWGIVLVRIIGWTGRKTIFRPKKKKIKAKKNKHQDDYEAYEAFDDGENLPPYPGAPRYDDRPYASNVPYPIPPYPGSRVYDDHNHYKAENPYYRNDSYYGDNSHYGNDSYYGDNSHYGNDSYGEPLPPYEEDYYNEDTPHDKEPFFMKSAYDGQPKPYDPKDPFQDWMDDYFPEDEDHK